MELKLNVQRGVKKRLDYTYSNRVQWWMAFTGDYDHVVEVPGREGYIYVRDWRGFIHQVFNNVVRTDIYNVQVKVGYDTLQPGLLKVLGFGNGSFAGSSGTTGGTQQPTIGAHHRQHEYPNSDIVWVRGEQILPALVGIVSGMTVAVWPHYMKDRTNNTFVYVPYTEINLTPYIPVSGACWALISVKEDGTVDVDTSTTAASLYDIVRTDINAPTDPSYRPLAAVILVRGMTSVPQNKDVNYIVDLRWSIGSQGTILANDYDLDNDGIVDVAEDTYAIRGKLVDPALNPLEDELLVWNAVSNQYESVSIEHLTIPDKHLHGQQRSVAGGSTTFDLLDIAVEVEEVTLNGLKEDPVNYELSADGTQVVFSSAVTAGTIVLFDYLVAEA